MNPTPDESPLWRQIADQLRSDIADEVYPAGSSLPGEVAVAQRYQTSRPTVRRAIAELASEGLVSAAHGRGTFVRPRPDRRTILIGGDEHPDFLDDECDAQSFGWISDEHPEAARLREQISGITDTVVARADRDQAEVLGIRTGQMIIYRFQYWRHRQTQRVISVTSVTPARLLGMFPAWGVEPGSLGKLKYPRPTFDEADRQDEPPEPAEVDEPYEVEEPDEQVSNGEPTSLYRALEKYGPLSFATTVTARMPRGDELNDLGIETGTAMLQIRRALVDAQGRPLEVTTIEGSADRFEIGSLHDQPYQPDAILVV